MQISTTAEEDRRAQTLLEEALEAAYNAGRDDAGNYTRDFGNSNVLDAQSLWEAVMKIVGVDV